MPLQPAAAPQRAGSRPRRHWLRSGQQGPEFSAIPSNLTFGPPADISMGWDGTLWAIDKSGAPHLYNQTEQQWQLQGQGISAAAVVPDNSELHSTLYLFRGGEFVTVAPAGNYPTSAPKTIAAQWPHLPETFKMGVVGATWEGYAAPGGERQALFLFNGGRYVSIDEDFGPPLKLTDLTNWPQTPNWKDGVIDGVFARVVDFPIFLLRSGEVIGVDLLAERVVGPPQPLSQYFSFFKDPVLSLWASGVDGMAELLDQTVLVFKGPVVGKTSYAAMAGAKLQYIGNTFAAWPVEWNPVLLHSPSGRVGDLWAVSTDLNFVLRHRGQLWARQTFQADNVSTGQDGTMMIASAGGIWRWDEESEASKQVGRLGEPHSGGSGQCKTRMGPLHRQHGPYLRHHEKHVQSDHNRPRRDGHSGQRRWHIVALP